eukprot:Em0021g589a
MSSHGTVASGSLKERSISELLLSLCAFYTKNEGRFSSLYAHALNILGSHIASAAFPDELALSERIQKRLARQHRESDAMKFIELHQRLSRQNVIQKRSAVIYFLLTLGDDQQMYQPFQQDSLFLNMPGLASSTWSLPGQSSSASRLEEKPSASRITLSSSGIGSMSSKEISSSTLLREAHSNSVLVAHTPMPQYFSTPAASSGTNQPSHARPSAADPKNLSAEVKSDSSNAGEPNSTAFASVEHISEANLLRDILFVFQGIEGKWMHYSQKEDAYRIDEKCFVSPSVKDLCHKLAELGWLYNKVQKFIDTRSRDEAYGLVGQSFLAALTSELTEYYRLVAVLEAQQLDSSRSGTLTLKRLVVWTQDPLHRLKFLGVLVDGCKRLKGGALVSALYAYSRHGDPYLKALVNSILTQVYKPLNKMLNSWIFDGELVDHFVEFFIASGANVAQEKLWKSKYSLHSPMLPSFVTKELAQKILIIGKSINFLHQRCHDHTQLHVASMKQWYINEKGEATFSSMTGPSLVKVVDVAYQETSKHLLHVLHNKYNFTKHLKALRRYLLLGQGDFIRHLMDLLDPDLSKPATSLYLHNLTGVLESAIRATNAQFDDQDILTRLDVKLLEASQGDKGWDVFSLHYHVDGPIETVFDEEVMAKYLRVFNFLWRAKRIEYYVANIWREMMCNFRTLHKTEGLQSILHRCQIMTSTMVHFISQLQYYITFEVMECCWASLEKQVQEAEDLDQIIVAHNDFLKRIAAQCLLDDSNDSKEILVDLRQLFNLILEFQQKLSVFFTDCLKDAALRQAFDAQLQKRTLKGEWGTSSKELDAEEERRTQFIVTCVGYHERRFIVLQEAYEEMLKEFLKRLGQHREQRLQFLCFRLDFNEHYQQTVPSNTTVPKMP